MAKLPGLAIALLLATCPARTVVAQSPSVSSIVNAASGDNLLAPGVLAAIFGNNLGFQQPSTVPISVLVNGFAGAVVTSTPQQITAQLPVEVPPGSAILQVSRQGLGSPPFSIKLESHAPGIFTSTGNLGSLWHSDGTAVTLTSRAQPGELLSLLATGLGPTNPSVPTGAPAPASPLAVTVTVPVITVATQRATVQQANLEPATVGRYRVFFSVPQMLPGGNQAVSLQIGGQTSNSVILPVAGPGLPSISSVVNAASFASEALAAPGSIVTLFGANFGQRENLAAFPATSFQGLSVSFNGIPAPLFHVVPSSNQINALLPTELPELGKVTVLMNTPVGTSASYSLQMAPAAPGIFRIPDPSNVVKNNAAAVFANTGWLAVPDSLARALQIPLNCAAAGINPASICGQPAAPGDVLEIFTTGLGKATPGGNPGGAVLPTGSVAPRSGNPLYMTVNSPVVTIGQVPAEVFFSGLAPGFAGLYQVNVRVPPGVPSGDEIPVKISTSNGLSDTATIAVRR